MGAVVIVFKIINGINNSQSRSSSWNIVDVAEVKITVVIIIEVVLVEVQ